MLRDAGAHFGLGCGGASVADVLATQPAPVAVGLAERLSRSRTPIAGLIGGRAVDLHIASDAAVETGLVEIPVRISGHACRLQLSAALIMWLGQTLGLEGRLIDEEPLQRALLLELASLDFIRQIEAHVGEDIRLGEDGEGQPLHTLDVAIEAEGKMLPLRIVLTEPLAQDLAEFLDRLQPPSPVDLSGVAVDLVVEAGSQDLSVAELESLRPGDVVMLASHRPVAVANGVLVAPVRRQSDGIELDGPFYLRSSRAMVGSLSDIRSGDDGVHLVHMIAESARTLTTVGAIDALKQRQPLPLSSFDETGIDLVIDNRRFGRGEVIMIGAGMGVRIVSLLPAGPACETDSQTS